MSSTPHPGRRRSRKRILTTLRSLSAVLAAQFLFVVGAVGSLALAQSDRFDLSTLDVQPNPRLGLAFPGSQTQYYPYMARAGMGVARIAVTWELIEPRPGEFNWRGLDGRVAALLALGIQPFLTFESKSDWATKPETHKVKNQAPKNLDDWRRFVNRVVERYDGDGVDDMPGLSGRVAYYQAANEWESPTNPSGGWIGSGDDLIAFINVSEAAVKAADPKAIFVLGGIAAFNLDVMLVAQKRADFEVRQRWSHTSETVLTEREINGPEIRQIIEERVLPVLREARYDIADAHLYGPEERDAARMALLADLTGRPVLSAECGGPSRDYGREYTPEAHFLAVVHRNLNVLSVDDAICLWFRLGEDDKTTWGNRYTALYDVNKQPKPGIYAYRMLARLIDANTRVATLPSSPAAFELRRKDGPVRVGWGGDAAGVRAWAEQAGFDTLCLSDPDSGLLLRVQAGSRSAPCGEEAFVIAGPAIRTLLSP